MGSRERLSREALRSRLLERDALVSEKEAKELPASVSRSAYDASRPHASTPAFNRDSTWSTMAPGISTPVGSMLLRNSMVSFTSFTR